MTELIQAQYDQLSEIAKRFTTAAERISQTHQHLYQQVHKVEGSWHGVAASAFFAEWKQSVSPALQRLSQALQRAGVTTEHISKAIYEAEQEAAQLFQSRPITSPPLAAIVGASVLPNTSSEDVPWYIKVFLPLMAPIYHTYPQWFKDILDAIFAGDFSENPSIVGVITQVILGFIPYAGQIADIRDIVAGLIDVFQGEEMAAVFLVIAIVAIIPGLDALKSAKILKPILKALGTKGTWEIVEFIAKNPKEAGRVGRTLYSIMRNPQLMESLAQNPKLGSELIRHGSPQTVELLARNSDAIKAAEWLGPDSIRYLRYYEDIADVPGAERLLRDLGNNNPGSLGELYYFRTVKDDIAELSVIRADGKAGPDGILRDGTVVEVKNYNWESPYYLSPAKRQAAVDEIVAQSSARLREYPSQPVRVVFTSPQHHVPPEAVQQLRDRGIEVVFMGPGA